MIRIVLIGTSLLLAQGCAEPPTQNATNGTASIDVPLPKAPDGRWLVTEIDGKLVKAGEFFLITENGKIVGGYDGCNSWNIVPDQPGMIQGTLQGCGHSDRMRAYDAITHTNVQTSVGMQGELLSASVDSHFLRARRLSKNEAIERQIADGD